MKEDAIQKTLKRCIGDLSCLRVVLLNRKVIDHTLYSLLGTTKIGLDELWKEMLDSKAPSQSKISATKKPGGKSTRSSKSSESVASTSATSSRLG